MAIAETVKRFIEQSAFPWNRVAHRSSDTSAEAAQEAHVPKDRMAKAVVLKDGTGYLVAVIPANHDLDVDRLSMVLNRNLRLAEEKELERLFTDCAPGAVPALGQAYGLPTVWDESLAAHPDVYFEGGDHRTLVHLCGPDFAELMRGARTIRNYMH